MESYFAGTDVTVSVPFVDGAGQPIAGVTNVSCQVVDAADEVLVDWADLTVGGSDTSASVTVLAANNALDADETRDLRSVVVRYTYAGGTRTTSLEYIIEGSDVLIVGTNSFQTYNQAVLTALDLAEIDPFNEADRTTRNRALINSYLNICVLDFELNGCLLKSLAEFTVEQLEGLPARFQRALRQAQLVEASELLDAGSVNKKRQMGLMSETIGESSMMFRPSKILQTAVTRRSLALLGDYLSWGVGIGRA